MNPRKFGIRAGTICCILVASLLFISPAAQKERSRFHSSQLVKTTVTKKNGERTDYTDEDGKITIAADLGYATVITTQTWNGILEQYFDDRGERIARYNGYYGLLQEYDDRGNNIRTSFLDLADKPMITANGYAIETRTFNEKKQAVSVRYYDPDGKAIRTPLYGYGKNNTYDENGKISRTTYIDISGAPTVTGLGYASIAFRYYTTDGPENGKIEEEFYFDDSGNPASLSLGEYGVHIEYDGYGRRAVLTYLDANGKPTANKKGYTKVIRTFHANGNVATEQYYDPEGRPVSLSEGQFGTRNEEGRTVYLDQDGRETFNLKNLIFNHSRMVIPAAMILVVLSGLCGKRLNTVMLAAYVIVICYLTLMYRERSAPKSPKLLWYYSKLFSDSEARADIIKNIWLFIPLGSILSRLYPKKTVLLVPAALSLMIECIQYFSGTGICELDDFISNSAGGGIGYYMGITAAGIRRSFIRRKQAHSA